MKRKITNEAMRRRVSHCLTVSVVNSFRAHSSFAAPQLRRTMVLASRSLGEGWSRAGLSTQSVFNQTFSSHHGRLKAGHGESL
jgi:hypothetical protein